MRNVSETGAWSISVTTLFAALASEEYVSYIKMQSAF